MAKSGMRLSEVPVVNDTSSCCKLRQDPSLEGVYGDSVGLELLAVHISSIPCLFSK